MLLRISLSKHIQTSVESSTFLNLQIKAEYPISFFKIILKELITNQHSYNILPFDACIYSGFFYPQNEIFISLAREKSYDSRYT